MSGLTLIIITSLFVVNLVLIALAITDLLPRENVKYLSKTAWIAVITVIFFSSIVYLLIGRGEDPGRELS